jgi:hypothetical protein
VSAETCAWCGEPATARAPYKDVRLPACELCAAMRSRKNAWMPCVINDAFDSMTPQQQARVYRATKWADNITNAEWPVVLGHEGVKAVYRSRLKTKAVGWLMAFSRIVALNPEFAVTVLRRADELYREQISEEPVVRWAVLADRLEAITTPRKHDDEAAA